MSLTILDDRDSSIEYAGEWVQGGDPDAEYQGTTTWVSAPADISATITFMGTEITVFGTIWMNDVQTSSYSLDGIASTFISTNETLRMRYAQQFFTNGRLSQGRHTLVITPVAGTLLIDYITMQIPATPVIVSDAAPLPVITTVFKTLNNSITQTIVVNTTGAPTIITESVTTTSSPTEQAQSPNQNQAGCQVQKVSTHIRPIVGGVLGGLGLLCVVFTVYYFHWRRNKKIADITESDPRLLVTPYDLALSEVDGDPFATVSSSTPQRGSILDEEQNDSTQLRRTSLSSVTGTLCRDSTTTNTAVRFLSDTKTVIKPLPSPPPTYHAGVLGQERE